MKGFDACSLGAALVALVFVSILAGTSAYYGGSDGAGCGRCHEIRPAVEAWQHSSHRGVSCAACHGSSFSADVRMHAKSLERVFLHARGGVPEQIHIRHADVASARRALRRLPPPGARGLAGRAARNAVRGALREPGAQREASS